MRNRLYLVGGVLLVAALGWASWQAVRPLPSEPVYERYPLSYWLTNNLPRPKGLIGDSNAVPFLVNALKKDSRVGAVYHRKWLWLKLPPAIRKHLPTAPADNPRIRVEAAFLLGAMGPVAKPAIPSLIRAFKEDDNQVVRSYAATALGNLGIGYSNVTAALTEALKDKDAGVRRAATNSLGIDLGYWGSIADSNGWGKAVGGVQMSVAMTNTVLVAGSTVIASIAIKNSSTNMIWLPEDAAPRQGVPHFIISLVAGSGKVYGLVGGPSILDLARLEGPKVRGQTIRIDPGGTGRWQVPIPIQTVEPGDYRLRVTHDFSRNGRRAEVEATVSRVEVK